MSEDYGSASVVSGAHWGTFVADVENGRVVRTRPSAYDPHPSPMVGAVAEAVNHKSRVLHPMVRAGWLKHGVESDRAGRGTEPFVQVSWDEALDLVAVEIRRVRERFGNQAIFGGSGWASAGRLHSPKALLGRFFNPLGGFVAQTTNWSFGAASIIVPRIVGSLAPVVGPLTAWKTILEHTRLIVAFGGLPAKNLQVNEGGIVKHRTLSILEELRARDIEIVYLSPLKDDVSTGARTTWLPLRPSTDTAAMLALAHTLVSEGLYDSGFVARCCTGFERFRPYLMGETDGQPKNAEWAAKITGIPAETLRQLARRMAGTRTMLNLSWSAQRADHGEQPCWMIIVLAALLGQIGLPGGGFGIGYGAIDGLGHMRGDVPPPMLPVPPNPVSFAAPVAKVVDMLLNPGGDLEFNGNRWKYPDVRLLYWSGGNPFHHTPDLNRMLEAWRKPETIVVHEPWWNAAARYADIVLPAATMLERNDIGGSIWDSGFYAIRQAIEPMGEARSDFDIFRALARRLDNSGQFDEGRDEMGWLRHLYDGARAKGAAKGVEIPTFDEFWREGRVLFPTPDAPAVPYADFRADPAGNALKTPSGKIELFSGTIDAYGYAECPGHPVWLEPTEWLGGATAARYPLHMISNQPKVRLHSQLEMTTLAQGSKVAGREPITLHPDDATARGINAGDLVRVFNGRGACLAGARLNADILRGVVLLSPGAWFEPLEPGSFGSLERNGTANVLTRDGHTSPLAQCSVQQSTLVEVERYEGAAPATSYFTPPPTVPRGRAG